jgi:carboxymethylenebutenolidase
MQGEWIALSNADDGFGMEGYHVVPEGRSSAPTVILLQEIFGVNQPMRDVAYGLARDGFEVLVPDLFWRVAPRLSLDYAEPDRTRAGEIMRDFDTDQGLADIGRAIAWLRRRPRPDQRLAAIGFCLGGKLATLLGARGEIDCGISFYGVQLDGYVDEVARAKSRLLLHFGERDAQIPLALVREIETAAKDNPRVELHVHPGAMHGFFNPSRAERYHPEAAASSGARTLAVLREVLGS